MKVTIQQNSKLIASTTRTTPPKSQLAARWQLIDGKLTRQWDIVEPAPLSNVRIPNTAVTTFFQTVESNSTNKAISTRRSTLKAEWVIVDSKLVCRWNIVLSSAKTLLYLKAPVQAAYVSSNQNVAL